MTRYRCPFWLAVLLTGIGTGVTAAALTRLLEMVQHVVWNGSGTHLLDAAGHAGAWRHILVLLGRINSVAAGQVPQDDLPRSQQYNCRDRALRSGREQGSRAEHGEQSGRDTGPEPGRGMSQHRAE